MNVKIIIDPRSSFAYSSFYIYGLVHLYGYSAINYSLFGFDGLGNLGSNMRFIFQTPEGEKKIFIHTTDSYHILQDNYQWCDIYGCVNANFSVYPRSNYPKMRALAPSFGVSPYGIIRCVFTMMSNFIKFNKVILQKAEWDEKLYKHVVDPINNIKHYFGRSIKTIKNRPKYEDYISGKSVDNYIFFLSTLWYNNEDNNNDLEVNLRRAHFIRACNNVQYQMKGVICEVGFANRSTSKSIDLFKDCMTRSVSMKEWIEKTKSSSLVFNTPAFYNCHGWKLGEYLALGKCIISTKLCNDLPVPLEHGKNIHFVDDNQQSMENAIIYILTHKEYRLKLESGAREYWDKFGTPLKSLELLGFSNIPY